jgi:WD40 repeat protein
MIAPLVGHTNFVLSAEFSPDGLMAATASDDQTVLLWNISDLSRPQRLAQPMSAHSGSIRWAAFSPDGRTIATASDDRTIMLWDLSGLLEALHYARDNACKIADGGLDLEQWNVAVPGVPFEKTC